MARSLKGGITEAYNILYHFYFSPEYRALHTSDEQFAEDLYTGCYGRYADAKGKASVVKNSKKEPADIWYSGSSYRPMNLLSSVLPIISV